MARLQRFRNRTGGTLHAFVRPFNATAIRARNTDVRPTDIAGECDRRPRLAQRRKGAVFRLAAAAGQMLMAVHFIGSESSTPPILFQLPPGLGAVAQLSNISSPDGQPFLFAVSLPASTTSP